MKSILAPLAWLLAAACLAARLCAQNIPGDPNQPVVTLTITAPADGEGFPLGVEVPIRATAVDTGGGITRLEFLADGELIGESAIFTLVPIPPGEPVDHEFIWRDAPFGRHELRVRGLGSPGVPTMSAPVTIQVGQVKPVATLVLKQPADLAEFRLGAEIELVAEATDPRGLITTLDFFANGEKVGTSTVDFCPPCLNPPCPLSPCILPPAGATLTHRLVWNPSAEGKYAIEARAALADGTLLVSSAVRIAVAEINPPVVTVTAVRPYALEGDRFNRGELVLERSGDLTRDVVVFFQLAGDARRGADYRLVVDPCDDCAKPEIELSGSEILIPAGRSSVTVGVFASFDGLLAVVERPAEDLTFQLITPPIPAVVGAVPPYVAGTPDRAEAWVVDRRDPNAAEVVLVVPAAESVLAVNGTHLLRAVAVDPVGSIRRVEFTANDQLVGISEILTRELDIPGRLLVHEFSWRPATGTEPGAVSLAARAKTAAGAELKSWLVPVKLTTDGGPLPTVTIVAGKSPAFETGDGKNRTGTFVVSRQGGAGNAEALDLWVQVAGTAVWGQDYRWSLPNADGGDQLPAFGNFLAIQIPAGAAEVTLALLAEPDALVENAETVTVRLIDPPIASLGSSLLPFPPSYVIGEPSEASVEIRNVTVEMPQVTLTASGTQFPAGGTVTLSATAVVPGQPIGGILFLANGREIGQVPYCCDTCRCLPPVEGAPFSATFEWKNVPAGTYAVTAQALTFANNLWESEPVTIRVGEPKAPSLVILTPTNGAAFKLGDTILIDTEGVDSEGVVSQVEFFANGLKIGETCHACVIDALVMPGTPLHNQLSWKPEQPGSYALTAVGQFGADRKVAAPPVVIRVGEVRAPGLTITTPVNGATFKVGETVVIDTVGQHPAGWVTTVEFFANGNRIGESCVACLMAGLIPPARELQNRLEWQPEKPGSYVLTAVGSFSPGGKATAVPVVVRVLPAESSARLTIKTPVTGSAVPAETPVDVVVIGIGRVGGITDVVLLVDGQPAGESHLNFVRAPGADEEVSHSFTVRFTAGAHELVVQDLTDRSVKSPPVRVTAAGVSASIVWNSPADGARFPRGRTIPLEVTATDPGGLLFELEYLAGETRIGRSTYSCETCRPGLGAPLPHRFEWTNPPVGEHTLTARGTRADGSMVRSRPLRLMVGEQTNPGLAVRRELPASYQAGANFTVRLVAQPGASVAAYVVEDQPPFALPTPGAPGFDHPFWQVVSVSEGGVWDPSTGKVKFGPFFDAQPRTLTYDVRPNLVVDRAEFGGRGSADGVNFPIGGDSVLRGHSRHPADRDPADDAISANELTAYAAAWKREQAWPVAPNPIPVDYVTRAAALWRGGENYRPAATAAGSARDWENGLATDAGPPGEAADLPVAGTALRVRTPRADGSVLVTLRVLAAPGTRALAIEEHLPEGATAAEVSSDGAWVAASQTLRWGPFFSGVNPVVSYVVTGGRREAKGVVSFDGLSLPIHDVNGGGPVPSAGRLVGVDPLPDGSLQVSLEAAALLDGAEFDLEVSGDLNSWLPAGAFAPEQGGGFAKDTGPVGAEVRFYRAVRKR
jgi:hypothetical protein